ncbi:response regulator transcription factor [Psychroflexus sp. ALD_RP9]|uniref:response regulator transcription factor n=1 Tax=Psychroflexus sp. ALD_RP9 TaxID=2777186 RepID=UPI001A8BFE80|nr:LuxR C-terminal-related transcriptional regulator [Psychroflexus sp. ALD_RP9]QSS96262.1 response regulator transcription factor [Psychroflexus sp. ALD_RP9]
MNEYNAYLSLLKEKTQVSSSEIKALIEEYKSTERFSIASKTLFYILNLNTQDYEFINNHAYDLTGVKPKIFKETGTKILPEIIHHSDYKLLVDQVFPKLQNCFLKLKQNQQKSAVFELYYRFKNKVSNSLEPVVEYSSYAAFDHNFTPKISTGIILKSSHKYQGVRGILRAKKDGEMKDLCDHRTSLEKEQLSKRQIEIIELICQGYTKAEVADKLYLAKGTIHSHVKNIYHKLNLKNQAELFQFKDNYL